MSGDINVQTFSGKVNINNNLKVGSGHLFVDTLNNQVGLNTNDPQANLHVNGNTYVHTNFRVGSGIVMNETPGQITAGSFVGDGSALQGINSDSGSWVNGTSSNVHLATTGDKVGIGVTDPDAKLEVFQNTLGGTTGNSTDIVRFGGDSNGAGALLLTSERLSTGSTWASTGLRLQKIVDVTKMGYIQFGEDSANVTGELIFGIGDSSEKMRIHSNGNVGIGTSSPSQQLDVRGGLNIRTVTQSTTFNNPWYNLNSNRYTYSTSPTSPGVSLVSPIDVTYSKNVKYTTTGGLKVSPPDTGTQYFNTTAVVDQTYAYTYGPFNQIVWNWIVGPIGASVITPYLNGDVFSSTRFINGDEEEFTGFAIGQAYRYGSFLDPYTQTAPQRTHHHSADMYFKTASQDGTLTEKMRIDRDGNVGIGTTDPGAPLHVNGDIAVDNTLRRTADNDIINIYAGSDSTSPYMFMTGKSRSSNANKIGFRIAGNDKLSMLSDRIYTDSSVNVGIGTSSPASLLEVRGTNTSHNTTIYPLAVSTVSSSSTEVEEGIGTGIEFRVERRNTDNIQGHCGAIRVYGAGGIPGTSDLWNMAFRVRSNDTIYEPMTIRYNGNVGIGTDSPSYKLDVDGNLRVTGGIVDTSWCSGSWLQTCTQSPTVTVYSNNGGGPMSAPGHGGSGMGGNRGVFQAKTAGNYLISCCAVHMGRGDADATGSNLLVVFDAVGTNWNLNNVIDTYDEIIDLRVAPTAEEAYTFMCQVYMNVDHYFSFRVHSSGYIDNNAKLLCSAALVR